MITRLTQQQHTHPGTQILTDLLLTAILKPDTLTPTGRLDDETPIQFYPLCSSQSAIGWDHTIIRGHWSRDWVHLYDKLTNTNNGVRWASSLLHKLWQAIIDKWKRRCDAEHAETPETAARNEAAVDTQIDTIYESLSMLDSIDKKLLHKPAEVFKAMHLKRKRAWIRLVQPHVTTGIQRAKQRQKLNTRPITEYFTPRAPTDPKNTQRIAPNAIANPANFDPPL